jgi:thymidylate synthase ThyX
MYAAKIIMDSINEVGNRLTTFEVTYPRFVHSEFMTHRLFSRNAASSRAIPNEKLRHRITDDPVLPVYWGQNQSGMQASEELNSEAQRLASKTWLQARDEMLLASQHLTQLGVHKQLCNRLLEPWMWITVIVTATEYENFFHLRCHPDAQPEIQKVAHMMRALYRTNSPKLLKSGMWHTPYIQADEALDCYESLRVSVARCARVSYLTHDGKREIDADLKLFDRLQTSGHWSPFEHVAVSLSMPERSGNFWGWMQYRKLFHGVRS